MFSDIPAGDGQIANLFYSVLNYETRQRKEESTFAFVGVGYTSCNYPSRLADTDTLATSFPLPYSFLTRCDGR